MSTEITNEIEKLEAFVAPAPVAAGLTLRPFTAGSLILLRTTGNGLLTGTSTNLEFDVAGFLYLHTADKAEVRRAAKSTESWRDAVLAFADGLSVKDFVSAANEIKAIMAAASVGQDYEVERDDHDPN